MLWYFFIMGMMIPGWMSNTLDIDRVSTPAVTAVRVPRLYVHMGHWLLHFAIASGVVEYSYLCSILQIRRLGTIHHLRSRHIRNDSANDGVSRDYVVQRGGVGRQKASHFLCIAYVHLLHNTWLVRPFSGMRSTVG